MSKYSAILEVYSLEDILEYNELTEEDVLIFLAEEGFLKLPKIQPLEFDD